MTVRLFLPVCLCLVLPVLPGTASAGSPVLGDQRLFTTAAQRARLDAARERLAAAGENDGSPATASTTMPSERGHGDGRSASALHLRGIVRRSDGLSAVWLEADDGGDGAIEDRRVLGDAVVLTLSGGRTIRLEPGQVYDPVRDDVIDAHLR